MQDLIRFMEFVKFKVQGEKFDWDCYGPNAWLFGRMLDDCSTLHLTAVFDTESKIVYELSCSDLDTDGTVRYVRPEFDESYQKEADAFMVATSPENIQEVDLVETIDEFYRKAIEMIEDSELTGDEVVRKMVEQGFLNRRMPI